MSIAQPCWRFCDRCSPDLTSQPQCLHAEGAGDSNVGVFRYFSYEPPFTGQP